MTLYLICSIFLLINLLEKKKLKQNRVDLIKLDLVNEADEFMK